MARAARTTDPDIRALQDQVGDLGNQLSKLLTRAKQEGGNLAEAELTQLQEHLQGILADVKDKGHEAIAKVEETVRERPGTSLLTAFAAGAIIAGVLMRR